MKNSKTFSRLLKCGTFSRFGMWLVIFHYEKNKSYSLFYMLRDMLQASWAPRGRPTMLRPDLVQTKGGGYWSVCWPPLPHLIAPTWPLNPLLFIITFIIITLDFHFNYIQCLCPTTDGCWDAVGFMLSENAGTTTRLGLWVGLL